MLDRLLPQDRKPRSKIIVLDAKDTFSKQTLFEKAWKEALFRSRMGLAVIRRQSDRGRPVDQSIMSDFDTYKADVANIIPPQKAGRIAELAGVADRTGWCPVDPVTLN